VIDKLHLKKFIVDLKNKKQFNTTKPVTMISPCNNVLIRISDENCNIDFCVKTSKAKIILIS